MMVALGGGGTGTHWDGGTGMIALGLMALGHTGMVALGVVALGHTMMVALGW